MRKQQWLVRKYQRGQKLATATHKYEPAFLNALREYSVIEGVAQSVILSTLAMNDARLRRIYQKQLTKEMKSNG